MITTLELMKISTNDRIKFIVTGGDVLTGVVMDADDPALLRVRLDSGAELRIGRGSVLDLDAASP